MSITERIWIKFSSPPRAPTEKRRVAIIRFHTEEVSSWRGYGYKLVELKELPEDWQEKLATLAMVESKAVLPGIGYKFSDSTYQIEVGGDGTVS